MADAEPERSPRDERTAPPQPDAAPELSGMSAIRGFIGTRLGVLRERDCALFFGGYTLSLAGASMVPVALSFAVLKQNHGSGAVGAVLAAETVPLSLLLIVGGAVADRLPRRAVMLAADTLRLASQAVLAALFVFGKPPIPLIMVLAAALGAGQAFFNPALTGFVPQIASEARLQDANALFGLSKAAARVVGPGLAGVLIAVAGAWSPLAIGAATYAISLVCLVFLHPRPAELAKPKPMLEQLKEGWNGFRERRWLWLTVAQGGVAQVFTFAPFLVLGATMFSKHGGSASWGAILAADGVGGLAGALVAMRLRPRRPLLVGILASIGLGLTPLLLGLKLPLIFVLVGSFVSGIGVAGFTSLFDTVLQRNIPAELLSRVSAYNWLGAIALSPVGYALAGPVANVVGTSSVLIFGAVWMVATTLPLLLVGDIRRLPWKGA